MLYHHRSICYILLHIFKIFPRGKYTPSLISLSSPDYMSTFIIVSSFTPFSAWEDTNLQSSHRISISATILGVSYIRIPHSISSTMALSLGYSYHSVNVPVSPSRYFSPDYFARLYWLDRFSRANYFPSSAVVSAFSPTCI